MGKVNADVCEWAGGDFRSEVRSAQSMGGILSRLQSASCASPHAVSKGYLENSGVAVEVASKCAGSASRI
jgi:hypothetical protein